MAQINTEITIPTITIQLCKEDRARLDGILEALKNMAAAPVIEIAEAVAPLEPIPQETTTEPEAPAQPKPQMVAQAPAEQPIAPEPTPTPAPAPAPAPAAPKADAPEVSVAELQSKVVQLVRAGKKDETRAIVMEYAASVGEIPAEKRAEVLERLNALEG